MMMMMMEGSLILRDGNFTFPVAGAETVSSTLAFATFAIHVPTFAPTRTCHIQSTDLVSFEYEKKRGEPRLPAPRDNRNGCTFDVLIMNSWRVHTHTHACSVLETLSVLNTCKQPFYFFSAAHFRALHPPTRVCKLRCLSCLYLLRPQSCWDGKKGVVPIFIDFSSIFYQPYLSTAGRGGRRWYAFYA